MTGSPAAEGRYALVVATARYTDPKLAQLRAPAADAERLGAVLGDAERGDFDVQVLVDDTYARVTRSIASFFRDRRPQDLLLLHFSCHGVKDERGELYLAATDTEVDLLSATGVSAAWLSEQIDRSRSRRTVVLLDCCFSGSFPFGMRARAGGGVDAPEQLQGRGRVIITASNAMEYAYEGDRLVEGDAGPSVFTGAIIEGIQTGDADLDGDRLISVDDLYDYVYDRVREITPGQRPLKKSELEGPLYLARSVRVLEPAAPAPEPEPEPPPPPTRRRWLLLAAAALAAVIAAAVILLLSGGDGGGGAATIPAGNLVSNPSFEEGGTGWGSNRATVTIETADDAPDGARVARVTMRQPEYSIDDTPNSVPSTKKGVTYSAAAWVKAATAPEEDVCIVIRERTQDDADVGSLKAGVTAVRDEYRPVRLNYPAKGNGNVIGVHVFRDGPGGTLRPGDAFFVDAITISPTAHPEASGPCPF